MPLRKVYGIDTGTSAVKLYNQSKDEFYTEKNMIAIRDGQKVVAVGDEAYEMYEKAPANVQVASPMSLGTIADIPKMEYILYSMLSQMGRSIPGLRAVIYFAIPSDLSQMDKRVYNMIVNSRRLQSYKIYMVEKPIADALALDITPEKAKGSMVMNIGAQSTELSVIAEGKVVISRSVPIGGMQMNQAVCDEIRRVYKLQIGFRTADRLKLVMGNMGQPPLTARKVYGIDSLSGLPREEVINSRVVNEAIRKQMTQIGKELKTFLERIPPQISYQILKEGIHLTGGTTKMPGISNFLAEFVDYGILLSELYEQATVNGLKLIINNRDLKKRWTIPM